MTEKELDKAIHTALTQMSMPHNLAGYGYIVTAIKKCIEDRNKLFCVTKGLYEEIAKENNDTASRVNRSISYSIGACWERGDMNKFSKIFGGKNNQCRKPKSLEFIAYMCDLISTYGEDIANSKYPF